MQSRRRMLSFAAILGLIASPLLIGSPASANDRGGGSHELSATMIADVGTSGNGSTVGPDGALYVANGLEGVILRVNPRTGDTRVFAEGLPTPVIPYGGVVDVVFKGHRAYALVTLVDIAGGTGANGIYRIDDRDSHTLIADISEYNREHPATGAGAGDTPGGNPYAIESVRSGFLVTDGNFNRLFHISKWGEITVLKQFGNVVPTGLETNRKKIYVGQAGPVPHTPETGRVISLDRRDLDQRRVASGYPLIVDVEFSRCGRLYALSNGESPADAGPAEPALPDTGALLRVKSGKFKVVLDELNLPTSVDFIRRAAYITSLTGEVWRVSGFEKCGGHGKW